MWQKYDNMIVKIITYHKRLLVTFLCTLFPQYCADCLPNIGSFYHAETFWSGNRLVSSVWDNADLKTQATHLAETLIQVVHSA
jgi:hypothetical protein